MRTTYAHAQITHKRRGDDERMTSILLSDLPDLRLLLVKLIAETQANTCLSCPISCSTTPGVTRTSSAHVVRTHVVRARRPHADDVRVTPGVVLHEIGQLRQVFAWVSAINLTSNNRRSGTEGLVNQTRGSHLGQLCIKTNVLLVTFWTI